MDEKLEDVLLIKNFLKMFDVYYEKVPYESMLDLKHKGKTGLYQEENKVGTLFYDGNTYKIILSLNGFDLEALSEIKKDKGRRFLTLNYNLVKNSDEIAGKYTINSCNKKNDKNNGKTFVVKHILYVYNDAKKIKYYRFYTIRNEVYLNDLKTDECVNFDNDAISHKQNGNFTNVRYDYDNNFLDYLYCYYNDENEPLMISGGHKLFKDDKKDDLTKIRKSYRIKMDELDPRYSDFVEEQKNTLDYFYDDLFNHIVKNSLPTLTGKEKRYIFDKKECNCYKLKR